MSARMLIIDGYNLLHAAGWAQSRYAPGELEACRTRLLKFLNERLSSEEAIRTTVVFDARHPPVAAPRFITHGYLRVLFAAPHGDADRMIEELLENAAAPRTITMISSDRRLQVAARSQRSASVSSQDFLSSLYARKDHAAASQNSRVRTEKPDAVSDPGELQFWLRVFGDITITLPDEPVVSRSAPSRTAPAARSPQPTAALTGPQPATAQQPRASQKSRRPAAKPKAVKTLSHDVTEWLNWAAEVQAWLDDLQSHGREK